VKNISEYRLPDQKAFYYFDCQLPEING